MKGKYSHILFIFNSLYVFETDSLKNRVNTVFFIREGLYHWGPIWNKATIKP